jgi:luciferase-like monooxygenase
VPTRPASGPTLKIAVLMPGEAGSFGEFLADARALETAGAHALWLDEGAHDPWMLAAALATVTTRVRLGVSLAPNADPATVARRLQTLDDLSRGRAELHGPAPSADGMLPLRRIVDRCRFFGVADEGGWAALDGRADGLVLSGREPDEDRGRLREARTLVGAGRPPASLECWVQMKLPEGHAGWRRTLAAYEAAGADGLLVSLDPRLVDLLRRGDEEDDRSDLTLAQG